MIELSNGYVIDQIGKKRFILKQAYNGIRKGVETVCYRTISNHTSFEDALRDFQKLSVSVEDKDASISVGEYISRLEAENRKSAEVVQNSMMERFYIDIPMAKGEEKKEHPIADLIPVGRENAIGRAALVERCVEAGIIEPHLCESTKDRVMRKLIQNARRDFVILNLSNGDGYYRVSREDMQDLQRYIKQEENRAKSAFKNLSMAKKLYEDYKHGRIEA